MTRPSNPMAVGIGMGVLTFVSYLPGLHRSLDFDSAETVGLFIRTGPPWTVFERQAVFNNHPFFSFLEQLVRVVTGRFDAATLRLLPIAFGSIAVGLLVWYVARRFTVTAGVIAGALVAANPSLNELTRQVRGYSLLGLCALLSTLIIVEELVPTPDEPGAFGRRAGTRYLATVVVGIATHLFMVLVVAAHLGMVIAARRFDRVWRQRFLATIVLSSMAYAAMAGELFGGGAAHGQIFQPRLPLDVIDHLLGGGWATVIAVPVVGAGVLIASRNRVVLGGVAAFAVAFTLMWVVYRSGALTPRFFTFLVPLAGLAAAVAIARVRPLALLVGASAVLAVFSFVDVYRDEPTGYRRAAELIRTVDAAGGKTCVSAIGVPQMKAYVDEPGQFVGVDDANDVHDCDVVVVAAYWNTDAEWYSADRAVIAAAEAEFEHRTVLPAIDPAVVYSRVPLSQWMFSA